MGIDGKLVRVASVMLTAFMMSACTTSQPLLPQDASIAPPAGQGTMIAWPMFDGCSPVMLSIARHQGNIYKVFTRVSQSGGGTSARVAKALPPGTYHVTGASCVWRGSLFSINAPYLVNGSSVSGGVTDYTGSLASFTVNAGEIVDIGQISFERPSAASDQGRVRVVASSAETIRELVKEQPQLAGRVVFRAAVAIPRDDIPK